VLGLRRDGPRSMDPVCLPPGEGRKQQGEGVHEAPGRAVDVEPQREAESVGQIQPGPTVVLPILPTEQLTYSAAAAIMSSLEF